jgi:hypothetical protein
MNRAVLSCLTGCFLALPALAQGTLNKFDCNSYGDYSECRASDDTRITCHNGASSECSVTHPNGLISTGAGPAAILIRWLVDRHREHVTNNAIDNASSTVQLTVKHSMHLMDMGTLATRLLPHIPPEQKQQWEQLAKNLADQSSAFSGAVANFSANWTGADRASFNSSAKKMQELYDSGLLAVCGARISSQVLTAKMNSVRPNLPADVIQALDAVRGDESLLAPECDSERASKLLRKQAEKTKPPGS